MKKMNKITTFYKYEGTGNDFIMIDNRNHQLKDISTDWVAKLCNRHFGIGADGLILLQNKQGYDFEMVYYNSDGNQSSMCGNGGRCIVEFARMLGIVKKSANFIAIDGEHKAIVNVGYNSLQMQNVNEIELQTDYSFLNTGSPHYVLWVNDINNYPVYEEGKKIRNNKRFKAEGTNVNFIEQQGDYLFVRTYERGVENETFSCGTGVTAAALIAALKNNGAFLNYCNIKTLGGNLKVSYKKQTDNFFTDIWLEGPATFVFKGEILY
jgi:diaminopimelate epimerase